MTSAELIDRLEKKLAECGELLAELKAVEAGDVTRGRAAAALLRTFAAGWQRRYGSKLAVNGAKDVAMLKRLLVNLEPADVEGRMAKYLADGDPFYARARHPLAMFVANANKFVPEPVGRVLFEGEDPDADLPRDCRHKPGCATSAQCTSRTLREMKGRR
jgi:hypothetical protein